MKWLRNISLWVLVLSYLFVALGFVNNSSRNSNCRELVVIVMDSLEREFVTEDQIRNVVLGNDKKVLGYPVIEMNLGEIERQLAELPAVKNAEAYFSVGGVLHVEITQREPLLRIINKHNDLAYLDQQGYLFPVSPHFSAHCIVANGEIGNFPVEKTSVIDQDQKSEVNRVLAELFELARFIDEDAFWRSQIMQIYYSGNGQYELIPRVGSHIILLGSIDGYSEKFRKLETLYSEGFNNIGWNDYTFINLKYTNQIVCTKRK